MLELQHRRHPAYPWAVIRLPTTAFERKCNKVQVVVLPRPPQLLPESRWVAQPTIVFEPRCKEAELLPPPVAPRLLLHQLLPALQWEGIPQQMIGSERRCSRVQEEELPPQLRLLQA